MKIYVIGTRGIPGLQGGVEKHCEQLYPRLACLGYEVTVINRAPYFKKLKRCSTWNGVKIIYLWAPRSKNLETIFHTFYCYLFCLFNKPDLVHIHNIGPGLFVPFFKLARIKTVFTYHSTNYLHKKWGLLARTFLRLGEIVSCTFADQVIVVAKPTFDIISQRYSCRCKLIPNGVDIPNIVPPGMVIERWRLTPLRYILAVGRIVPEKGFHDLLEAFGQLETNWNLVIAGAADHEDNYSKRLREIARRDKRVILTGYISGPELYEIYSNAGLFVIPSYHEGLPIVLLEAMSYDLPILASDIPANRELVKLEETFPVGDVDMLSQRLSACLEGKLKKSQNRSRIDMSFNWDKIAVETEKIFLNI